MRERFDSDELKTYEEAYRATEKLRTEELSRSEEFFRTPEFLSEGSRSSRSAARRKNMRRQRSLLASIISAVGTAAGAVLIVAAVIMSVTEVTLSSVAITTHSLQFELTVNWSDTSELTAILTSDNEHYEQIFSNEKKQFTILFESLTPDTEYHLEVTDGTTIYLSEDCRTAAPQLISPVRETVLPESISIVFDSSALTDIHTVYLDDIACGNVSADSTEISWSGLLPETSYRVTVKNKIGDIVFDKTYITPAYEVSVTETASEISMTLIYVELNVENAGDTLTATIAGQSQTLSDGVNVIQADGLMPGTGYTLEVGDGNEVYFSKTYITNVYKQKLFPAETVLQESIELLFSSEELTASSYTVMLNGAVTGNLSAAQTDLLFDGLTPETSYRVTIEDDIGNTVFDKTYITVPDVSITEISSEISMTKLRVELYVENMINPLTVTYGGNSQTLQNGTNIIELSGLSPGTVYAVRVTDGTTEYFFQTYRTANYVQTLFPVEQYVGIDTIFLQFDETTIPEDGYTVYVNNELYGVLNSSNFSIVLENLTPNTTYHIEVLDSNEDIMLEDYYLTPYLIADVASITCAPTYISLTLFIQSQQGQADVSLRSESGEYYNKIANPENSGEFIFENLTPLTDYTLTITDDRGTLLYKEVLRTELAYSLISISGTEMILDFPSQQFDGIDSAEILLDGVSTGIAVSGGEVTLRDLTPLTEYEVAVSVNGTIWWQKSFTTPDIIINSAAAVIGSTDLSITFDLQNPQNDNVRVVLLMGNDIEIDSSVFTSTDGQTTFTASFETIPNGLYVIRLVRESDNITLYQTEHVTANSFTEVTDAYNLSETENGDDLWEIVYGYIESTEIRVFENSDYFTSGEITAQCVAADGSGELIPNIITNGNVTSFYFEIGSITLETVYEFRLYRNVDGMNYLIERLYWKCVDGDSSIVTN